MLPCPSLSRGVYSDSRLFSQWCYLTISSFATLFSVCLQSFPASGFFSMSWLFASDGRSIGASALASVLSVNIKAWFPLGLVWSPCCPWDSQESSPASQFESIGSLALSLFLVQLSHLYMATGNTIALTIQARIKELIQYGAQKAFSTGCLACPRMDFPGGPVVGSPPANVGDAGFIPWSRRTPHAVKSLTPRAPITEPAL